MKISFSSWKAGIESLVIVLLINSGQINGQCFTKISSYSLRKKSNSMTLRVELPTAEDSGLRTLVKFVADPVVWWELSRSWVTHTGRHALFGSQPPSTLVE